jgi:hypothetical protein
MTLAIITRAAWGARAWATTPYPVAATERRYFVVHYDGGAPVARTGIAIPRAIDAEHRAKGWAGVGYNFVVSQAGEIYEGRGWDLVGAHCPSRNRDGIGVQVAIGGDQVPTAAALHAVDLLYAEGSRRAGLLLARTWHGANFPTDCPGPRLISWVRAGMPDPIPPAPTPQEDDVLTADEITDRILAARPTAQGGAAYRVREVDQHGDPALLVITEALALQGQRQREILARLDAIDVKLAAAPKP